MKELFFYHIDYTRNVFGSDFKMFESAFKKYIFSMVLGGKIKIKVVFEMTIFLDNVYL